MAKMVNGQRNLGANHAPDPSNIFIQLFQALFRHMHVSKGWGILLKSYSCALAAELSALVPVLVT